MTNFLNMTLSRSCTPSVLLYSDQWFTLREFRTRQSRTTMIQNIRNIQKSGYEDHNFRIPSLIQLFVILTISHQTVQVDWTWFNLSLTPCHREQTHQFSILVNTHSWKGKISVYPSSCWNINISRGHFLSNQNPQNRICFCEIVVPMESSIPPKFYCFMATRSLIFYFLKCKILISFWIFCVNATVV
jgi:hypothetical protein